MQHIPRYFPDNLCTTHPRTIALVGSRGYGFECCDTLQAAMLLQSVRIPAGEDMSMQSHTLPVRYARARVVRALRAPNDYANDALFARASRELAPRTGVNIFGKSDDASDKGRSRYVVFAIDTRTRLPVLLDTLDRVERLTRQLSIQDDALVHILRVRCGIAYISTRGWIL